MLEVITMDIWEAVEEYRAAKYHLSPSARRAHKQHLAVFAGWCEAHGLALEQLSSKHVRLFLIDVAKRPGMQGREALQPSTVKLYGIATMAFLRWCVDEGEYDVSPKAMKHIELPKTEQTIIQTFTDEQLEQLLAATERAPYPIRDKALLSVLIDTGCRAAEVVGLLLPNIWLEPEDSHILVTGKRKQRELSLGKQARLALRRYITRYRHAHSRSEQHVFLARTGEPLTVSGLEQAMMGWCETAHIRGVRCSPHSVRHSFACRYLLATGDLYRLAKLMGHSSVKTSERYLQTITSKQARQGQSVLDTLKQSL